MKITKKQLEEMVIKMIQEDDFDVPEDWTSFDDFEFQGAAKDAAQSDIEASGEDFEDIGTNKFEKGMNQKDFASKVSQANLNLPSDEAELSDIKKRMQTKQDALDNVKKFGMSLNESEERRQLLAGITKSEE